MCKSDNVQYHTPSSQSGDLSDQHAPNLQVSFNHKLIQSNFERSRSRTRLIQDSRTKNTQQLLDRPENPFARSPHLRVRKSDSFDPRVTKSPDNRPYECQYTRSKARSQHIKTQMTPAMHASNRSAPNKVSRMKPKVIGYMYIPKHLFEYAGWNIRLHRCADLA